MDQILTQKSKTESTTTTEWKLDVGYLFKALQGNIPGGGAAIGDFGLVEYEVNGTIVWSLTGQEIDEINKRDGLPAFDGANFIIPFGLEGMKDQRMRELTYINTGVKSPTTGKIIASHLLRINWNVARTVNLVAAVSANTPDGPGLIRRFQRGSKNSGVGTTEWTDANKGKVQWAFWRRLFVETSAGAVSALQIQSTTKMIWGTNIIKAAADMLAQLGGHVAGGFFAYVADFTFLGSGYNALAAVGPDGTVKPDTADNPLFDTAPVKNDTVTVTPTNTVAGNNTFLLEAVGEID